MSNSDAEVVARVRRWTYDEAGLATRLEIFLPHQEPEALEAVGLSEQDASEAS